MSVLIIAKTDAGGVELGNADAELNAAFPDDEYNEVTDTLRAERGLRIALGLAGPGLFARLLQELARRRLAASGALDHTCPACTDPKCPCVCFTCEGARATRQNLHDCSIIVTGCGCEACTKGPH